MVTEVTELRACKILFAQQRHLEFFCAKNLLNCHLNLKAVGYRHRHVCRNTMYVCLKMTREVLGDKLVYLTVFTESELVTMRRVVFF